MAAKPRVVREKRTYREITLTINADEDTLDRLATMLLFARVPVKKTEYDEPSMPWPLGDEGAPEPAAVLPEAVLRVEVAKRLQHFAMTDGVDRARKLLRGHGAEKLSEVAGEELRALHDTLIHATPGYTDAPSAT